MSDFEGFEQRLRATVAERSEGFEPSADLPGRITARVRRRQVRRQLVAGGLVAAAAAVAVVVGLVAAGGDDEGSIRMSDRDSVATTTESTTPRSTTVTTSTPPPSSTGPAIDMSTPLNRQGVGPIRAGMTLREAQEAGGVTLVPTAPNDSGNCVGATFEGLEPSLLLLVETTGPDVMDGVVRGVVGSVLPTEEGAIVGQSRDELLAALGPPTRTEEAAAELGENAERLVFEAGGYAYGALVADDMVLTLLSGDPAWISDAAGCPI